MSNTKRLAIDLAKNIFQVCALDEHNKVIFNKKIRRPQLIEFIAKQESSPIYMEARYSSHYWARRFNQMGHQAGLIPAQHVKPFVRGNKNDHNDALAIAECAQRPVLKLVPVKTEAQQEIIALHRIRSRWVKNRVQISNQLRGLLTDFGIVMAQGHAAFIKKINTILETERFSAHFRASLLLLKKEYDFTSENIKQIDQKLEDYLANNESCQIVKSIPGIGVLTSTLLVAMIDKGQAFKSAKDIAVWSGLTPKQHASGDYSRLGRITKRGDHYLRRLLVQGALTSIRWAKKREDEHSRWITQLAFRLGTKKAAVAIAHKMIRLAWVLLQKQKMFQVRMIN